MSDNNNADELSKIDALIAQHSDVFEGGPQLRYSKGVRYGDEQQKRVGASAAAAVPQGGYRCHRCGEAGHFIQDCPQGTEEGRAGKVRQARGIPKTFLETVTEAEAGKTGGAFVSAEGDLVVMKSAGREERLRLVGPSVDVELQRAFGKCWSEIKTALTCFLCSEVVRNPVATNCCGELFCRQCILQQLDRRLLECPHCERTDFLPTDLLAERGIGQLVGLRYTAGADATVAGIGHARTAKRPKMGAGQPRSGAQTNIEVDFADDVLGTGMVDEEMRVRPVRHVGTVLVPGGQKNPFFDPDAPLLSEQEFARWQARFKAALDSVGQSVN